MNRSEKSVKSKIPDFELPDWSGMIDSPQRISIEAAFALNEECPEFVSEETIRKWREQRPGKCEVEFVF